jgi:lipopolysaccharide/colanic/teichoic acid biosynthesis glycosyltransferase
MYRPFFKYLFDLLVVLCLLPVALPLALASAIALAFAARFSSPILFRQTRPGLGGKPFTIYKFKTMRDAWGPDGKPLPDAERLTRVGQVLRSLSLDELPQLINVVQGDMSLVGPRPLLMDYLDRYTPEQARRMEVKPGITGWAQVNGRNGLTWEQQFKLDVEYVDRLSFVFDLKILLLTVLKVVRREGIAQEGHATREEFRG